MTMQAGYEAPCVCGARIREGDTIGLVDDQWVCEECVVELGEDPEPDPAVIFDG